MAPGTSLLPRELLFFIERMDFVAMILFYYFYLYIQNKNLNGWCLFISFDTSTFIFWLAVVVLKASVHRLYKHIAVFLIYS